MTNKNIIRQKYLERRKNMLPLKVEKSSLAIVDKANKLLKYLNIKTSSNIALYYPINNEVNLLSISNKLSDKYNLCLPCLDEKKEVIFFRKWDKYNKLFKHKFNIMQPDTNADIIQPDLIFIPLIAVDKKGNRIGYGRGHFDKTLNQMGTIPILVGVCYDWQILDLIKSESHDVKLDYVISESHIIDCRKNELS